MAIVSPVLVLPTSIDRVIERCDFGIKDMLTGSEGGGIGVEEEEPVIDEEKIFVAVGKEVKDGKEILLWGSKHFAGKTICLLHVHQPAQMIPLLGGKFPANKLKEEEVKAYRALEKLKMHKMLNEYIFICAQVGVRAEKFYVEMENIEEGIVGFVAQHGIKKLIMGAAASKHKRITTVKSKKAIFVSQQAHISCHIWFVWKGCLIHTREDNMDGWDIQITESPLTSSITETSQAGHLRSRSITEGQSEHVRLSNLVQKFIGRVRSQGRRGATVDSLNGTGGTLMSPSCLGIEESVSEWDAISRGNPSQDSSLSPCPSSEEIVGCPESTSLVSDEGSVDGSLLSPIQGSEEDTCYSCPMHQVVRTLSCKQLEDGNISREMYDQLQQAMTEIETSKREALEELVKCRKTEKDALKALRKAKESESLYSNEVKQRKEMEVALAINTSELNNIKRQRDEVVEELRTTLDQKLALERQIADSGQMLQELEKKNVNAVERLVSFKQERERLQLECDNAVKEAEQLRKMRAEESSSSHGHQFVSEFSFSEIDAATCNFDSGLLIGQGGYGSVYKGYLHNPDVAIKLFDSSSSQGRLEFQQEDGSISRKMYDQLQQAMIEIENLKIEALEELVKCQKVKNDAIEAIHNDGSSHEIYDQLQQAMIEIESLKREAFEELAKCQKAEKDAVEAIHKAKESERLHVNEVKQRKEMEVALAMNSSKLNKIERQLDEVVEALKTALEQKMALERQIADSGRMLQELEEKNVNAVELLVSFKQDRERLQFERDKAVKEAAQLSKMRGEEWSSSHGQRFFCEFSFSEIDAATRNFDSSLIIGQGGYGSVYRGYLRNTDVAIKLLDPSSSQGRLEFQQEVEVLSRMRHPNLLTLIGACPEAWSLVYEYLPNGNLEDRLACNTKTPPLPWQTRVRIAVDICSALIFLHCSKPHGIVHGDIKPSNILLDANFISKLGDFGICHSITGDETSTNSTTLCCRTDNPKGTILYMDPEFLTTGEITPKSDVYSFGIVLLQLLTGRPALGIAKEVQQAVDKGTLSALLDSSAGDWIFVQAEQLAHMALRCCEMNSKHRPDLTSEVWRVLEPMKAAGGTSSSFSLGMEKLFVRKS